jgi:hypothetical protein
MLLAVESFTIARLYLDDAATEEEQLQCLSSWGVVLDSLEEVEELQRYMWAILCLGVTCVNGLIGMSNDVQKGTVAAVGNALEIPDEIREILIEALPDMRDIIKFDQMVQQMTLQAMKGEGS